jgi:predicted DNA-binding WGR domain protein
MSNLRFYVDTERLADQFGKLKEDVKTDLTKGVENLANMTHARTLELAGENLTSLQKMYKDNVEFSNPAPNFWVVTLKEPAMWIEEGRKAGFMEELLNGKSGRTGKNGKYAIIPFHHNKNPTEQSAKAYDLAKEIQYELKKKGVNWKKIEKDEDGSPRLGKLHTFQFDNARAIAQKATHKNPLTKGVSVYQTMQKDGSVRRDVMTFRVISEKSRNEGAWVHPGRPGSKILDKAFDWAMSTWEKDILPAIFEKYNGK